MVPCKLRLDKSVLCVATLVMSHVLIRQMLLQLDHLLGKRNFKEVKLYDICIQIEKALSKLISYLLLYLLLLKTYVIQTHKEISKFLFKKEYFSFALKNII